MGIILKQILSEFSIPNSIIEVLIGLLINTDINNELDMKQIVSLIFKEYYCLENKCISPDLYELILSSLNGTQIDKEKLCNVICRNIPLPLQRIVNNALSPKTEIVNNALQR